MAHTTTWEPMPNDGDGTTSAELFAFPRQQRDPLRDATHVRNALEHFATIDPEPEEKEIAFSNLKRAADQFHVEINGNSYDEVCCRPQSDVHMRD